MLTLWEPITHLSRSNSVLNSVQLLRTQSVGTPSAVRTVVLLLIGGLSCLPAGLCWDLGLIYFFGCCLVNSWEEHHARLVQGL